MQFSYVLEPNRYFDRLDEIHVESASMIETNETRLRFGMPLDEFANSVSHGVGLIASLVAAPILLSYAARGNDTSYLIGVGVFACSVVVLYLSSTLYHSLKDGAAKDFFRLLDHSAIFLLIAGSYTPFTLGALRGPWGWTLLVLIWSLASVGLVLKVSVGTRHAWASISLYVVMGWLAVIAAKPIWLNVPLPGILLILAGGVAYTGGLIFFAADRLRHNHLVWHVFVMIGTTCHIFAVLWYSKKL